MSLSRQNYHEESEAELNKLINLALHGSYFYLSMGFHFDRDDVALPGIHAFFKKRSDSKRELAIQLMEYQNKRGGRLVLQDVKAPSLEWSSHVAAFDDALAMEKKINEASIALCDTACKHGDSHLEDFIQGELLDDQVKSIKQIADLITNAKRAGDGLGAFVFDRELSS